MATEYLDIPYTPRAFTEKQFQTFLALADTYFPPLTQQEIDQLFSDRIPNLIISPKREKIENWLHRSASDCRDFVETLDYYFYARLPKDVKNKISMVLDLLGGGIGTFILTIPYFTFMPFASLSQSHRIKVLKSWSQSYLPALRQLHRQFQLLLTSLLLKRDEILLNAMEYPIPIPGIHHRQSADSPVQTMKNDSPSPFTFLDLSNIPKYLLSPTPYATQPSETFPNSDELTTLHFDLVIVGTGAGGSVVSSTISQALLPKYKGYRILIVDKGTYYHPATDLPMDEFNLAEKMFDSGVSLSTADGQGIMTAASTWGGGPVINWGICLELEDVVRKEWSENDGLEFLAPKRHDKVDETAEASEWDSCMQRVRTRMGATLLSSEHHGIANKLIEEGAKKAGYNPKPVPFNNGGKSDEHKDCGYCTLGCTRGIKQSGAVSWLVDAAEAGATMLQGFDVERIIFEGNGEEGTKAPSVVKGVEGRLVNSLGNGRSYRILASKVILAAGAVRTPCIMKNSGLGNPNIGKHLKLHSGFPVTGFFDPPTNTLINPWDNGPPVSLYVPDLSNINNTGYGAKIMRMDNHPSISLATLPWNDPTEFKLNLCRYKQSICIIVIVRDRDSSGSVTPTEKSNNIAPKIEYTLGKFDKNSGKEAILASIKILVNAGCSEVFPCIGWLPSHLASYKVDGNCSLEKYMQDLERYLPGSKYGAAHIMGSARMGRSKTDSVVDAKTGKVWDFEGLYVADAGLFPGTSGVNPMMTIMGLAEWVARKVVREVSDKLGNVSETE